MELRRGAGAAVVAVGMALAGCGSAATLGGDTGPDALGVDASGTDAAGTDVPGTDAVGGVYIPTGFALTPFLSDAPVRSFPMAEMVLAAGRDYQAVVETDAGRMVFDLYERQTPITVNSFVWLARHHYFDGIAFHRVVEGFVVQGGDPNTVAGARSTWGTGGPGYSFGLEIDPTLNFDTAGVVGMARTMDPNSNGSQFYVTLAATRNLDGMYTVFGRVAEGMDVLARVARGMPPATPTRMTAVYIVERPAP